jgi:hypothetical protein
MTITKEQVADLREGDVVEMTWSVNGGQVNVRGPLVAGERELLSVAGYWVREPNGSPIQALGRDGRRTLTVVSRAPRPLYVNHPRTAPVDGDIARDRDGDAWRRSGRSKWYMAGGSSGVDSIDDCKPLTLLWDGQMKQVVP